MTQEQSTISPTSSKTSSKEFVFLVASLMSLAALSIDALLPALGFISEDLQVVNRNHTQYLIGGIFAGMALGQLVWGPLSDALGRRKILFAGIALYLLGTIICYFGDTLQTLLVGRLIQGLGIGGPQICAMSIVRDKYQGRQMAKIMSIVVMVFMAVPALAPSIGQAVMFMTDWRGIFIMYLGYALVIGVWIFFRLPETLPKERRIPFRIANIISGFREVFAARSSMLYMICMGVSFGCAIGYLNSAQQIFQDLFGAGEMFSVYFGSLAAVVIVSCMLNSRFVERMGMRYMAQFAFIGMISASAIFLFLHLFVDIKLWMFLTYAGALFFCFGFTFGNLNALAMEPMGHIAGIAAAVIGAVSSTMSLTLGAVIGQMYNGTVIPMAAGFFILASVALTMMRLAGRHRKTA